MSSSDKKPCKKHPKYKAVHKPRAKCRDCLFFWQRKTRGWDDSDTWSLDMTIAAFVLPRLERFKEIHNGVPGRLTYSPDGSNIDIKISSKNWDNILDKMIAAFKLISEDIWAQDEDRRKITEEGLDLFREYYGNLWW